MGKTRTLASTVSANGPLSDGTSLARSTGFIGVGTFYGGKVNVIFE